MAGELSQKGRKLFFYVGDENEITLVIITKIKEKIMEH